MQQLHSLFARAELLVCIVVSNYKLHYYVKHSMH